MGSVCAAVTIQGLVAARAAFTDLQLSHEAMSRLEAEIEAAVIVLDAETQTAAYVTGSAVLLLVASVVALVERAWRPILMALTAASVLVIERLRVRDV